MKCKTNILLLLLIMSIVSCNDMDNDPTNSYTDKTFWTSIEKAQYMLNMAYSQMYSAGRMWNDERLSDNVFQGRGFTDQRTIRNGIADASTGIFASEWSDLYGGIKTCHIILEHINDISGQEEQKASITAQTRFIRAYLYARLVSFYGDVPFFTQDISYAQSKTISRTSGSEVIAFVHNELDDILASLPTKEQLAESERGKITQAADLMLQARLYLYDQDYANVEKYCDMIMSGNYGSYSLFPSYSGLFDSKNEYNSEVILDVGYVPAKRTWGDLLDMIPLSKGGRVASTVPTQSLVDSYLTLDGDSIKASTTYDESNPYQNRDPRLTATVIYDGYDWSANVADGSTNQIIYTNPSSGSTDSYQGNSANQSCTGYYVRKYYDPDHEANVAMSNNIIMMRYADVLLMYAEAMNEQGKMTEEVWNKTIQPIRKRAGFTAVKALDYPDSHSQAQMRIILRRERRSELALEGLRWFDIKRWKAGKEYLNGTVKGARFGANNSYISLDNYQFDETRDYLWSVPQSQMDINENLKPNNPGWSN